MNVINLGSLNHVFVNGLNELMIKERQYKPFSFHKQGETFITFHLSGDAVNLIKTAFLMTEENLPEKIDPYQFGYCFIDGKFDLSDKTIFLCQIDSSLKVIDSRHYFHKSHFIK